MPEYDNLLTQKDIDYVKRDLADLKVQMTNGFNQIHTKLELMAENYVRKTEMDEKVKDLVEEIGDLKDNQKWVVRTIITLVIGSIMGLITIVK